jgi:hypothetical protein
MTEQTPLAQNGRQPGPRCEVCDGALCAAPTKTGVCMDCRRAGATFARRWMRDLLARSLSTREIGVIVGVSREAVRARLSNLRRVEGDEQHG